MNSEVVYVENIGQVRIKKNNRSKNIRITVHPYQSVTVSVPTRVSVKKAIEFIKEKEDWILHQLKKTTSQNLRPVVFNEETRFKTSRYNLVVKKGNIRECALAIQDKNLIVIYPEQFLVTSNVVQEFIRQTICQTLKSEAKEYLPFRVAFLAEKYNFQYRKIFIKNTKSRWGSCSAVNNINLNQHLLLLPRHLSDYVILHELVHTIEKNHGRRFWEILNKLMGDAKKMRRELAQYSHYLYEIYI